MSELGGHYNLRKQKGQVVREIGIVTGLMNEPFRRLSDPQKLAYSVRIKTWEAVLESLDELSRRRQECDDLRHIINQLKQEKTDDCSSPIEAAH